MASSLLQIVRSPSLRLSITRANFRTFRSIYSSTRLASTPQQNGSNSQQRQSLPRNEQITAAYVNLVDANGVLQPLVSRTRALSMFDQNTHVLLQVSEDGPNNSPVCKIMNKAEMREHERNREKAKKAAKRKATSGKQLEINYAMDPHDLSHRLKHMEEFLREGRRVEIFLVSKKKGRQVTLEEANAMMAKVRNTALNIEGVKELKIEGKVPALVILVYEGKKS